MPVAGLDPGGLLDGRFAALAVAAGLAGLVRGFSGFGAAMVFVPLASALYGPPSAVVLLFVMDLVVSAPMLPPAFRRCRWAEVAPLAVGATLTVPLGVRILTWADPLVLRYATSTAILAIVAVMAAGWRYRRRPSIPATLAVGGVSGLAGGAASLYGPPVILFWLGGQSGAATVRANVFAFFGVVAVAAAVTFWLNAMFTRDRLLLTLLPLPAYAVAMWAGARSFRRVPEGLFRGISLALCAAAALAALPLWDGLWR